MTGSWLCSAPWRQPGSTTSQRCTTMIMPIPAGDQRLKPPGRIDPCRQGRITQSDDRDSGSPSGGWRHRQAGAPDGVLEFVDVRLIAEHPPHDREPGSPVTGDDSGPRAAHPGVVLPTCGELVKPSGQWALRGQGVGRDPPEVPLATSMQLDAHGPGGAGSPAGLTNTRPWCALPGPCDRLCARPLETPRGSPMNVGTTASGLRYEAWNGSGAVGHLCPGERPESWTFQGGFNDSRSSHD